MELNRTTLREKATAVWAIMMSKGLGRKLLMRFLGLGVIPLILISLITAWYMYNHAYTREMRSLEAVAHNKMAHLHTYFSSISTDLLSESSKTSNVRFLLALEQAYTVSGTPLRDFVRSYSWALIEDQYSADVKVFQRTYGYDDLFLIDLEGNILYSVLKGPEVGENIFTGALSATTFSASCRMTLETGIPVLSDIEFLDSSRQKPAGFFVSVVVDEYGQKIGLMALQIPFSRMNAILEDRSGMGKSGESYLVGDDLLMRSSSRFDTGAILKVKVGTEAAKAALRGESGTMIIPDYRGVRVLSTFFPCEFPGGFTANLNWAVITELDRSEAFAGIGNMLLFSGLLLVLTSIVVIILALFTAERIVQPIRQVTRVAEHAARGEITMITENLHRKDEIGVLTRSFDKLNRSNLEMVRVAEKIARGDLSVQVHPRSDQDALGKALATMLQDLKTQIMEIRNGVNVLSSSSAEISASMSQLAAISSETASSVSQTTTTVEEVRHESEVTAGKAKKVSDASLRMKRVSREGTNATESSVEAMKSISGQMTHIAELVIGLEEQSETIGEITSTVSDLADQSNLLALNAAIEAAKAEEHGEGFAVVAGEIRLLADQSKQAATQVRHLLREVNESIQGVRKATQDGGKLSEEGVKLTLSAGDTIKSLTGNVEDAADNALHISSSSQQQLEGIEQVMKAMEGIREASINSATSTRQMAETVSELKELGEKLEEMMKRYKLEPDNPFPEPGG